MPITKNHTTSNTVSMMYSAIKNDDVEMLHDVISLKGDIYAHASNGSFFTRALSNNSMKLCHAYTQLPHFEENVAKYRPQSFYFAINYGSFEAIKFLASLELERSTLCIETILRDSNFIKSEKFILNSGVLAFMISPDYYKELKQKGLSSNLLLSALTTRELDAFAFIYENRKLMGAKLSTEVEAYLIERMCYANEVHKHGNDFYDKAYKCLDKISNPKKWDKDKLNATCNKLAVKIRNTIAQKQKNDMRWRFIDHLVTNLPKALITKQLMPIIYVSLLVNRQQYRDYIEKNKGLFTNCKGQGLHLVMSDIQSAIIDNNGDDWIDNEAKRMATETLVAILKDSSINTTDITCTLQNTGQESKATKQAIVLVAIDRLGFAEVVQSIRHVSYINVLIELGYQPYEILIHTNSEKFTEKLTKMIVNI